MSERSVLTTLPASATRDGDGVLINRAIGARALPQHDPLLLLDELRSDNSQDYIGGFPAHPHRGFETVTYMVEGRMRHRDSAGNSGVIEGGGLQWMTAGSGILHSEMPEQNEGRLWGFQLWINLAAAEKMRAPRYQEFAAESIPLVEPTAGARVKVLAGTFAGVTGPVDDIAVAPLLLDIQLLEGVTLTVSTPDEHAAVAYTFAGRLAVAGEPLSAQQLALLGQGESLVIAGGVGGGRCLLIAAKPLQEPIARYGPFVMNRAEELHQAMADYQRGLFGLLD
ncbi:pirin family protein [Halioxenophilus sp. WMMB6]|uniref:pirin family protein n=1 Tax=Halioxenophilus sp. WMMB6 TaxID=3073815 RepID=UPI00295E3FDC|nr:pirin family protein [Halioxenophilus sp. WMMB6]